MRTGTYINQLHGDLQYKAFIPAKLPLKLNNDSVLQDLLSKADFSLGKLEGVGENIPDVDFFLLMYVRKESTLSSQIEGTQATFLPAPMAAWVRNWPIDNTPWPPKPANRICFSILQLLLNLEFAQRIIRNHVAFQPVQGFQRA